MTLRIWSPMVLAALALAGCAAGRGTYFLAEAQQHVRVAEEAGAPTRAVYAWTMADQYMRKAWEEWGNSDFEDSEKLARKASEWADKAEQAARSGSAVEMIDRGSVPENRPSSDDEEVAP